jgi:hypothetical protein
MSPINCSLYITSLHSIFIPYTFINLKECRRKTPLSGNRSYFMTDSRSVSQNVLVWSTLEGFATRYYFLSESFGLVSVGRPL